MVKGLSVHPRHLLLFCMLNVSTHHRLYRILWGIDPWQNSPLQRVFQNLPMTVGQSCQKQIIDPLTRPGAIFAAIHPPFHNLPPSLPSVPLQTPDKSVFYFHSCALGNLLASPHHKTLVQRVSHSASQGRRNMMTSFDMWPAGITRVRVSKTINQPCFTFKEKYLWTGKEHVREMVIWLAPKKLASFSILWGAVWFIAGGPIQSSVLTFHYLRQTRHIIGRIEENY